MIVVGGPTASGKSDLAVDLALALGGEVISADAMMIWRGFDIGTAKPTQKEMRGAAHHMIDVADPGKPYTVADYQAQARAAVEEVEARGKVAIVCGGTGLYLRALLWPMGFGGVGGDPEARARWEEYARECGPAALHAELARRDPCAAAALHENDVRRVVRALEVFAARGSSIRAQEDLRSVPEGVLFLALERERAELIGRIDRRVDRMLEAGLVNEVKRLREAVPDGAQAMQGIGYKQIAAHLRGEVSLAEAALRVKIATRQYAKRQMTWLRGERGVIWQRPAYSAPGQTIEFAARWLEQAREPRPR